MSQYGMIIDTKRCVGCRTCMVACKMEHRVPLGVFRMKVFNQEDSLTYDRPTLKSNGLNYDLSWTPMPCMQCREPKCLPVCPTGAIVKRADGIVYIDDDKCNGCAECISACPYGVPMFMDDHNKADKCDFCRHRVDVGKQPICVDVCPSRAIEFAQLEPPYSDMAKRIAKKRVRQMYPGEGTDPSVYYR